MRTPPIALLAIFAIGSAQAQAPARAELLIIGTYHMANPGHDLFNSQVDDVLAPKRQQEISELVEVLKTFRPTKIALEASAVSQRVKQDYADYVSGKSALTRNERDQLGFRLAKELHHAAVYPVDVDGDFPYLRVQNYAKANGLGERFDAEQTRSAIPVKEGDAFLRTHTVLETFERMNADSSVARDAVWYYDIVSYGEPYEYAGPDLLASWYQRNIRIYHNITKLIDTPAERILVIYGSGHLGWLRQIATMDAHVHLVTLSDLTSRK